ncbi:MAG: aldehyde ferredoxin oxidoreductase family protein [Planctomycetota bacterium]|nr:aldehyde ferredoxin oxidoreductase family protein [Planctomycetota bacterium]MDA1179999.1 aldehyde ferredoxin oxidoreductase family protein [Planctomycetota bacterium]
MLLPLTVSAESQAVPTPGYHGRYLWVDLTSATAELRSISARDLRRFLGGSGLATYLLLYHGGANCGPTDAESPLVFSYSPLVGSPLTTSAKFAVVSRSPLTGMINDSLVSSAFALAGKRVGVDAMVITGRCETAHYLLVDGLRCEVRSAAMLRGRSCRDTEQALRKELGNEFQLAVIGPAGENGVRYATISHDGRHAGRGGNGAVMGSKNLKAIAVRGDQRVAWAHPLELQLAAKELSRRSFGSSTSKYRELGTAANLSVLNRLKALPTRNFQQGEFAEAEQMDPVQLAQDYHHTRSSCAACTIGCEHMYQPTSSTQGISGQPVRVEYENLFALGPLCGIHDVDAVLRASQLCDDMGIDTISTGGTVAFAMECVERGWLTTAPWLRFGDSHALLRAIELIGRREGVGVELGLGSRAFSVLLGPQAESIAPHVKGLELPGYEPRAAQAMAVGFAVGTRGADHNRSGAYQVDFSEAVDRYHLRTEDVHHLLETEDQAALFDSVIFCKFLRGVFADLFQDVAEYLRLVTGWEVTSEELRCTARRIVTLKKMFNVRAGWVPSDDTLPERMLQQSPIGNPQARITSVQLQDLVRAYNLARGWTAEGWVPSDTLRPLDLLDLVGDPSTVPQSS